MVFGEDVRIGEFGNWLELLAGLVIGEHSLLASLLFVYWGGIGEVGSGQKLGTGVQ